MKGFIIYPDYLIVEERAYVQLYGRLENGESFVTFHHFQPYFYIKANDLDIAHDLSTAFLTEKTSFTDKDGNPVIKIILDLPADVPKLRRLFDDAAITCYEADIKFPYRFLMDHDLKGGIDIDGHYEPSERVDRVYKEPDIKPAPDYFPKNLRILSFDIESGKTETDDSLYCIGLVCDGIKKVFINTTENVEGAISCASEAETIERFFDEIIALDPDIITGWNVIDFDLNYLHAKSKRHKIPFCLGRSEDKCKLRVEDNYMLSSKADFPGRVVLDGIHLLEGSFIKLDDYKLNTAAHTILGDTKLVTATGLDKYKEIDTLWHKNKKKLVAYNLKDAELVTRIIEKTKVLELTIERSILTGMPPDRVNASIASLDSLYIREAHKRNLVVPTGHYAERGERIQGGYVRESEPGIYDFILILDFKSLYPSIIKTFNIDPLSYVENADGENLIEAPNGAHFKNQDGILPSLITSLWKARDKARKDKNELARHAIKIHMNSMFGVLANPSCRFYDLNIANAITHFSHMLIKLTSEQIEKKGYKVIYNDSITKDRFVTLLINDQLTIKNIEELFNEHKNKIIKKRGKETITFSSLNIKALTLDHTTLQPTFNHVTEIIRHKTDKTIYRINQKYGETVCTEDHSLMTIDGHNLKEVKPTDLNNKPLIPIKYSGSLKPFSTLDLYELLKHYIFQTRYKGRTKTSKISIYNQNYLWFGWTNQKKPVLLKRFIKTKSKEFKSLCRLLAFYIAEGASSTPETTHSKRGATLANSNQKLLKTLQRDYYNLFSNVKASIIRSSQKPRNLTYINGKQNKHIRYEDKTYKLQMMNQISAVFFKMLCGQKSTFKKLPGFIYHAPKIYQKLFLQYLIFGDGGRRENDFRYSASYKAKNFSYSSSSLHLISGLSFLLGQLGINYSLQYRKSKKHYTIQTSTKNNIRLHTKLHKEHYNGYVYDLNVQDNHMFVDSCGQILLHNTDSAFVISNAKTLAEAEALGKKLATEINTFYKTYTKKNYNRENALELEFSKCYIKCIMPRLRKEEAGAKKRYAGLLMKDGKETIEFTGLESARGDWTQLAKNFQYELLDKVFHNKEVTAFVKKFVIDVRKGTYDHLLVYKKALRKDIDTYAVETPHKKAAKKILAHGGKIESNIISYVLTEDGPEPVDYIEHKIDYDHYINKQLKPIADSVLGFFNTNFEAILKGNKQVSLFDY